MLDADGLAALSMRRVAHELDRGVMSLYRHVAGRDELLDLVLDELTADVAPPGDPGSGEPTCRRWPAISGPCSCGGGT